MLEPRRLPDWCNVRDPEIVMLGASSAKDGNVRWQSFVANDNGDVIEGWGECPVMQAIGVTSMPAPADDKGHAEGFLIPGVGGRKAVLIGGRDTRDAEFLGKLEPGDTVVHSTGPNKAAQLRLHNKKRSGAIIVRCEDGKDLIISLDGKNKKLQVMARGAMIEIDDGGDMTFANKGGAAIMLQGDTISLNGNVKLPGMPPGMYIMCTTMAGPATIPTVPGSPATLTPGTWMPLNGVGGYT